MLCIDAMIMSEICARKTRLRYIHGRYLYAFAVKVLIIIWPNTVHVNEQIRVIQSLHCADRNAAL